MQEYGEYFHPKILGVTGTTKRVAAIAQQYGAAYRKSGDSGGSEYLMDHTADLYLIDRAGRLYSRVRHGTPPAELLRQLRQLLAENR